MSAPRWAVGMRKIGPGCYVDAEQSMHVNSMEICDALGVPPTEANYDLVEQAAREIFMEMYPGVPIREGYERRKP